MTAFSRAWIACVLSPSLPGYAIFSLLLADPSFPTALGPSLILPRLMSAITATVYSLPWTGSAMLADAHLFCYPGLPFDATTITLRGHVQSCPQCQIKVGVCVVK